MSAILGLVRRRILAAPGRWLGAAGAVAVAVALLGALSASGVVAGDHAARRALAGLSARQRSIILTWSGGALNDTDVSARRTLGAMGARGVARGMLLTPTDFGRGDVRLAGIAPLAAAVRVRSGRLPRGACAPRRCEVLYTAGNAPGARTLASRGLHLVIVGRAFITDQTVLGFGTSRSDLHPVGTQAQPTLLLTGDPAGIDALHAFDGLSRTQNWSAPLPIASLHQWQLTDAIGRIAAQRQRLDRIGSGVDGGFTVTSPQAALESARARGAQAPGRLAAAGAAAAAALAAFLILAAGGLRTGLLAEDARLLRGGATARQRAALAVVETGVPVLAGVAVGILVAIAAALVRAATGGVGAARVLADAAAGGAGRILVVAGLGWALTLITARAPARVARPAAAAGLLVAAALLAGMLAPRGTGDSDPLPAAVIPMAGAVAGLLVALVIPAALRRAAVLAPARRPLARVALLELAREPGPAAIAAAGLAVSVGLAGFAFAYRATLERSRSDQAGHRVPVTAVVSPGPSLRSPLAVSPLTAWAGLRGARDAAAVVRRDAFVIAGPTRDPVTAVGVPARLLGSLPTWRAADAQGDRGALARRLIAPPFDRPPGGVRLDSAGEGLVLPARADGDRVRVSALVRDRGGTLDRVVLGTAGAHTAPLHARLPARDRGGQLAGIVVEPDLGLLVTITHHIAEGGNGGTATGVLHLGRLRAGTTTLRLAGWQPHGPLRGRPRALHYHLEGPALLRPAQPSDRAPLPVLADPATAHDSAIANGVVLDILGVQVRARVVGVVRRLPTVPSGHGLALADATALAGALDAQVPGNGEARELWLSARPGQTGELDAAVGAAARRHGLVLHTHAAAQRALAAEPIGREVLGALAAAAALAAALGLLGVAIALRRALRDGSGALLDLEAQGLGPAALRRGLRLRGAAIAVAGVLPGLVLAVALTSLVTGAVRAGAAGTPDPPLVSVVPWTDGALAALGLLIGAAVVGALAVAPSLREAVPRAAALTESA